MFERRHRSDPAHAKGPAQATCSNPIEARGVPSMAHFSFYAGWRLTIGTWLQPGVGCGKGPVNRFSGFELRRKATSAAQKPLKRLLLEHGWP